MPCGLRGGGRPVSETAAPGGEWTSNDIDISIIMVLDSVPFHGMLDAYSCRGDQKRRQRRRCFRVFVRRLAVVYVVIYSDEEGEPGFQQARHLDDAVAFVEHIKNVEGAARTQIFRMEEIPYEFRTEYVVEVVDGNRRGRTAPNAPTRTATRATTGARAGNRRSEVAVEVESSSVSSTPPPPAPPPPPPPVPAASIARSGASAIERLRPAGSSGGKSSLVGAGSELVVKGLFGRGPGARGS
jgi:hypothetical protein